MPKLTKRIVDATAPRDGDFFVWDSELKGFGLRVWPSGRKSFVLKYQRGGRGGVSRRVTIGDTPTLTVDEARRRATSLRAEYLDGADPAAVRKRERGDVHTAKDAPTVAQLADAFLVEVLAKRRATTSDEYTRLLGTPIAKIGVHKGKERVGELRRELGRLKVREVTREHIARLHRNMGLRPLGSRPYLANRALAILSALFTFAERRGDRDVGTNPCRHIKRYEETARERYLTVEEFARLGEALRVAERDGLPLPPSRQRITATETTTKHRAPATAGKLAKANPIAVAALRFLLLTGWREQEALTLKWSFIDMPRAIATLPRTKTGRDLRNIGEVALDVLKELRTQHASTSAFVFPSVNGRGHLSGIDRLWTSVRFAADLHAIAERRAVRLHDLRHAFASVAASGGVTLQLIGTILGHRDIRTTQRYAHLLDSSRRDAANFVSGAVQSALDGDTSGVDTDTPHMLTFKQRA